MNRRRYPLFDPPPLVLASTEIFRGAEPQVCAILVASVTFWRMK